MGLTLEFVRLDAVEANPWNPNRMSDKVYAAELESMRLYGFVDPITVRPHGHGFQIIDGEHRVRALRQLASEPSDGSHVALRDLIASEVIPAIVLPLSEQQAKRLTVILNETRGRAEPLPLGELLRDLATEGGEWSAGLPYDKAELDGLVELAEFDWSALESPEQAEEGDELTTVKVAMTRDELAEWEAAKLATNVPKAGGEARYNGRVVAQWARDRVEADSVHDRSQH